MPATLCMQSHRILTLLTLLRISYLRVEAGRQRLHLALGAKHKGNCPFLVAHGAEVCVHVRRVERDLFMWQKRPINTRIPEVQVLLEVAFFLLLLSMVAYGVLIIRLDGIRQFEHIVWPRPCLRKVKCSRKPWVHLRRLKRKIAREPGVKKVYSVIVCI